MKQKARMGIVLLLVSSLVLGGCARGVSQETYEAIVAERDAAQADLATAEAEVGTLEADLTTAEAEVEILQADLATAEAEVETLRADLATAEVESESFRVYLATTKAEVEAFEADLVASRAEVETLDADYAALETEHHELQAMHDQLVGDYEALKAGLEPSPHVLPLTLSAGNSDITIKEAHFAKRVANFGPLGKFVVLTLEVTNIGRTDEYIFGSNFLLIGRERRLYSSYDFGFNTPTGFLWRVETITAEATLELKLAFDVPADEHSLYLLVTIEPKLELWTSVALGL